MSASYLTDVQYIRLLGKIERGLKKGEQPWVHDNDVPGNKFTTSNLGLCNDKFTDKDMAMWPEDYPSRKTMKYKEDHHICPFDSRLGTNKNMFNGCYYTCKLAKGNVSVEKSFDLVALARKEIGV